MDVYVQCLFGLWSLLCTSTWSVSVPRGAFHSFPERQVAGGTCFCCFPLELLRLRFPPVAARCCQWASSSGTTTKGSMCGCQGDCGGICVLIQAAWVSHGGELTLPEMERRVMSWKSYWTWSHKAVATTTKPLLISTQKMPFTLTTAHHHRHRQWQHKHRHPHPQVEVKKLWLRAVNLLPYKSGKAGVLAQMCLKPWPGTCHLSSSTSRWECQGLGHILPCLHLLCRKRWTGEWMHERKGQFLWASVFLSVK